MSGRLDTQRIVQFVYEGRRLADAAAEHVMQARPYTVLRRDGDRCGVWEMNGRRLRRDSIDLTSDWFIHQLEIALNRRGYTVHVHCYPDLSVGCEVETPDGRRIQVDGRSRGRVLAMAALEAVGVDVVALLAPSVQGVAA